MQQTDLYENKTPSVICAKDEVILCDRLVTANVHSPRTLHAPARLHLATTGRNQLSTSTRGTTTQPAQENAIRFETSKIP